MIGTEELANVITSIPWHTRENEDSNIRMDSFGDIPEGWTYVGSGAFRHCFLGPDNVVYKVPTADGIDAGSLMSEDEGTNLDSFFRYQTFLPFAKVAGVRLAKCHLFDNGVMAQEFIDGDYPDDEDPNWFRMLDTVRKAFKPSGLWADIHALNVILVQGEPVLIDW